MAKQQEEEEYEVQYINAHKIVYTDKNRKPSLQFEIKWKGYPNSQNTWEPESATEHAQDLVDQYWAIKGGGKEARRKVEKILKKEVYEDVSEEVSEDEQDEDEYEEELPKTRSSNKRLASPVKTPAKKATPSKRRKTTTTTRRAATESEDEEEVVLKSKGKKKSAARKESEGEEEEDADTDNEDFSESEIEKSDFRLRSTNWEKEVEKVQKVRQGDGANKDLLYGIVRWRDGKLGIYKTAVLAKKIPQLLIKYYEKRLTFEQKN